MIVIQGTVDAHHNGKLTQSEISNTVEFCFKAFTHVSPEQKEAVVNKLRKLSVNTEAGDDETIDNALGEIEKSLTPDELQVLNILRGRRMIREDNYSMDSFTLDTIDGLAPRMERGKLGLARSKAPKLSKTHLYSADYLEGERCPGIRAASPVKAANGAKGTNGTNSANGVNGHANDEADGHTNGANGTNGFNGTNGNTKEHTNGHENGSGINGATQTTPSTANGAGLFVSPINGQAAQLGDVGRHALMNTLHQAAEDLETPFELVTRLGNSVSPPLPLLSPLPLSRPFPKSATT
jgi:hypothetical protein